MSSKYKNNKSICTENKEQPTVVLPAQTVADIANVSESLVKKVRSGHRNSDTPMAKRVQVVDELYEHGSNLLIKEIEKIVKL